MSFCCSSSRKTESVSCTMSSGRSFVRASDEKGASIRRPSWPTDRVLWGMLPAVWRWLWCEEEGGAEEEEGVVTIWFDDGLLVEVENFFNASVPRLFAFRLIYMSSSGWFCRKYWCWNSPWFGSCTVLWKSYYSTMVIGNTEKDICRQSYHI